MSSKHDLALGDDEEEEVEAKLGGGSGRSLLPLKLLLDADDLGGDDSNAFSSDMPPPSWIAFFMITAEGWDDGRCLCRMQRPVIVMATTVVLLEDGNVLPGFLMIFETFRFM